MPKVIVGGLPDQRITAQQRQLAQRGEIEDFWKSRGAVCDPVARSALQSLKPRNDVVDSLFGGDQINDRLSAFSKVYVDRPADISAIRSNLMEAHIEAVEADSKGRPGLLSREQIADYHHRVFRRYGLPSTAFGGTPFTGRSGDIALTRWLWGYGADRD